MWAGTMGREAPRLATTAAIAATATVATAGAGTAGIAATGPIAAATAMTGAATAASARLTTAGADTAATAKNAIRQIIRARKNYKGSGNLVLFTSEDWLSEWLLLEDQFGHSLYKDTNELATKMRVQQIVTVPQMEGMEVDGQELMAIAVDLKDYATGTNRRGKVEFFDDFDINFNQYTYLIETRLSGMLRKPYSAMTLKIATATKGGPFYNEATPEGTENPRSLGWYELEGDVYRKSADATVITGKTYYTRTTTIGG